MPAILQGGFFGSVGILPARGVGLERPGRPFYGVGENGLEGHSTLWERTAWKAILRGVWAGGEL